MLVCRCFLIGLLVTVVGCTANTDPPRGQRGEAAPDDAEKAVRAVMAELLMIEASAIPMDKPISDPPIRADELDLVEMVMELEERQGVTITDAALERYLGGKFGTGPPRITPNQLATIVREAPPLQQSERKN